MTEKSSLAAASSAMEVLLAATQTANSFLDVPELHRIVQNIASRSFRYSRLSLAVLARTNLQKKNRALRRLEIFHRMNNRIYQTL
jgi:hypothetical protein